MNSVQNAMKVRAQQLANAIANDREMAEPAIELALAAAFNEITAEMRIEHEELRAELAEAVGDVARLRQELDAAQRLAIQFQRESEASVRAVERARGELEAARDAIVANLSTVPQLAIASSRSTVVICDGSGKYFANVLDGGALLRRLVECPGCPRCKHPIEGKVLRGV